MVKWVVAAAAALQEHRHKRPTAPCQHPPLQMGYIGMAALFPNLRKSWKVVLGGGTKSWDVWSADGGGRIHW